MSRYILRETRVQSLRIIGMFTNDGKVKGTEIETSV